MKRLSNDIFSKIFYSFVAIMIFLVLATFAVFKYFVLDLVAKSNLEESAVISDFHSLFFLIVGVSVLLITLVYYLLKNIDDKVNEDVENLTVYIHDVSENKNYDAVLKIHNYIEFLHLSVVLKNMVKRLNAKDKKK